LISSLEDHVSVLGAAISVTVARIRSPGTAISFPGASISCLGEDVSVAGTAISVTVARIRSPAPLISRRGLDVFVERLVLTTAASGPFLVLGP